MATIVHSRESVLQLANSFIRILPTNGFITASSSSFSQSSGTISPSSITLVANVTSLPAASYYWTKTVGGTTTTLGGATTGSHVVTSSQYIADLGTNGSIRYAFVASLTNIDGSVKSTTGYFDIFYTSNLGSVIVNMTNPAVTLSADNAGTVSSYTPANCDLTVQQNGDYFTFVSSLGSSDQSKFTVTRATGVGSITLPTMGTVGGTVANATTYSNMTTDNVKIDFTITVRDKIGVLSTHTRSQILSKAKAGTNGTAGTAGSRGTVQVIGTFSGLTTWSNTSAASVLSSAGYGSPQTRDIVTLQNTDPTVYTESRFYDGSTWLAIGSWINGNMVVSGTLAADKITTGTLTGITINGVNITGSYLTLSASSNNPALTITGSNIGTTSPGLIYASSSGFGTNAVYALHTNAGSGVTGVNTGLGNGVTGISDSGAGVSGNPSSSSGYAGIYGFSSYSAVPGVRANNSAGGIALQIDTGTLKWGSTYTYTAPPGNADVFLNGAGGWTQPYYLYNAGNSYAFSGGPSSGSTPIGINNLKPGPSSGNNSWLALYVNGSIYWIPIWPN